MKKWNEYRPKDSTDYIDLMVEAADRIFENLLLNNLGHVVRSFNQRAEDIDLTVTEITK